MRIYSSTQRRVEPNYSYAKDPLTEKQKSEILYKKENQKIIDHATIKIAETKNKAERTLENYRLQCNQ